MNRLRNILTAMAVVAAMAAAAQFPNVVNPEIPAKVTFAGNTVSLDRDDMYERLDRELTAMAYTHGNTLLTIKRANRYFPVMAPILKRNGVPLDMLYLACIESTLNPRALSPAGAAGFWQLMPATAKEFGLEVNNFVDERGRMPLSETRLLTLWQLGVGGRILQRRNGTHIARTAGSGAEHRLQPLPDRRNVALHVPPACHETHHDPTRRLRILT